MAIPVQHTIKVIDNQSVTGHPVAFPFKVVCSCQWEALALNLESADYFCRWHSNSCARYGNPCTVVPYPVQEVKVVPAEELPEPASDGTIVYPDPIGAPAPGAKPKAVRAK